MAAPALRALRSTVLAVVAALALGACGRDSPAVSGLPTTAAPAPTTSAPLVATTTTAQPTSTTTARAATSTAVASPEAFAKALYAAWTAGDRAAAAKVAEAAAVDALFARRWQAADGWAFVDCNGAAGSVICTWRRPAGEQLLMRVRNLTGGEPVIAAEVRFQP